MGQVKNAGWFGCDDPTGEELVEILESFGISVDSSYRFSTAPTISKSRVTASNQQICRVDREASPEQYNLEISLVEKALRAKASSADAVVVSDYGKGFVTNDLLSLLSSSAKFVSVDPKPGRLLQYTNVDLLTPNELKL